MAMGRTLASRGRSIGLVYVTSGPGLTNLITGVSAAFEERVPIFVLSGNVSTSLRGRGAVQDGYESGVPVTRMLEAVTARSVTVMKPDEVIPAILELDALARETRRPVHLNIPIDVSSMPAIRTRASGTREVKRGCDRESFAKAAELMLKAERPLIFSGNGIKTSGLEQLLCRTAESVGIPVITSTHAKGTLHDGHPWFFGCFGFGANSDASEFLKKYRPTAIVYLGTRLGESATAGWAPVLGEPEFRIHVDRDESVFGRTYTPTHSVCGEIRTFLEALLVQGIRRADLDELLSGCRAEMRRRQEYVRSLNWNAEGPVDPAALIRMLDLFLPENAVVFSDIGSSMAWLIHHLELRPGQEFHLPMGFGGMGSGICCSLGAKTVYADRPVVCVTGDCAALMHGNELFTAARFGLGVKFIILNDGGHGLVHHGHELVGLTGIDVRFRVPADFGKFGEALGVKAYEAGSLGEFTRLPLDEILSAPGPAIIDVRVDRNAIPPILARARVVGITDQARC